MKKEKIQHILLRALPMAAVLAVLVCIAVVLNRTEEEQTESDASRMVYASAEGHGSSGGQRAGGFPERGGTPRG